MLNRAWLTLVALAAPVLVGLAACDGRQAAPAEVVRDSAGVTIVENADLTGLPNWTLGVAPVLELGSGEDDGFGLIVGVVWLADGTIAVADAIGRHVRLFSADGMEVATAGRRGEGPGEFETIQRIWPVGPDSVAVWDARLVRYTMIGADGGLGSTVRLEPTGERARPTPLGTASDGRLIAESNSREIPSLEYYRAEVSLLAYEADGTVSGTIVTVPGVEMWDWVWEMGTSPSMIPFGKSTLIRLHDDAVYVGANEGYQIDRYDLEGRLVQRIRLDRDPRPLPASRVEAYVDAERAKALSSAASKGGNDIFGMMAEAAPYPDVLPFYDAMLIDDEGRIWVRDYPTHPDAISRFTVFGPDGLAAAIAELPARFTPTAIQGGRVIGIWRDELDLEHVRVYELVT